MFKCQETTSTKPLQMEGLLHGLLAASIRNMQQVLHALRTKCERCPMLLVLGCCWFYMNTCPAPDLDMTPAISASTI